MREAAGGGLCIPDQEDTYPTSREWLHRQQADGMTGSLGPEWRLRAVESFLCPIEGTVAAAAAAASGMPKGADDVSLATYVAW